MAAAGAEPVPKVQRAVVVSGFTFGDSSKLPHLLSLVTDKPVPTLQPGQVLVRMLARSVNPADGLCAMGFYPGFAPASALPATLGLEGMGKVAAAAPDVTDLQVGQRVLPIFEFGSSLRGQGSWQEYVAMDAAHVLPLPDFIPDPVGAQLAVNPSTVFGLLQELQIPTGEFLLQTQAGGSVGRQLITLCKSRGIRTINVVRRREAFEELKALGADEVICSTDEDVKKRVMEITGGKGAYGAVESIAGKLTGTVVSSTREGGTVLLLGGTSGPTSTVGIQDFIFRGVTLKGFWLNSFIAGFSAAELRAFFSDIIAAVKDGVITPTVDKLLDLSEFQSALEAGHGVGGKIILVG